MAQALAKLGTNVEILKLADGESYTKDAFVQYQRLFGKGARSSPRSFRSRSSGKRKEGPRRPTARRALVVQAIPAPRTTNLQNAGETNLFGEGVGSRHRDGRRRSGVPNLPVGAAGSTRCAC